MDFYHEMHDAVTRGDVVTRCVVIHKGGGTFKCVFIKVLILNTKN